MLSHLGKRGLRCDNAGTLPNGQVRSRSDSPLFDEKIL